MVQAAKISITGTQRMEGVEPETLGLVTEGSYCYEPGLAIVSYVESEMTGLEGVVTSFTVEDGRTVTPAAPASSTLRCALSAGRRMIRCTTWASAS